MAKINWTLANNTAFFKGELSIYTIDIAFERETIAAFKNKDIIIDLAEVVKIDTAGLAWLLCLIENVNKTKTEITFHNVPQDLLKLAKLSAVDLFLPTQI